MSLHPDACSLILLDFIQQRIPDAPEIPELEALVKEEILQRQRYKDSNGIPTIIN